MFRENGEVLRPLDLSGNGTTVVLDVFKEIIVIEMQMYNTENKGYFYGD